MSQVQYRGITNNTATTVILPCHCQVATTGLALVDPVTEMTWILAEVHYLVE